MYVEEKLKAEIAREEIEKTPDEAGHAQSIRTARPVFSNGVSS